MPRLLMCLLLPLALSASVALAAEPAAPTTKPPASAAPPAPLAHSDLSAATIVEKNIAARGGLAAWRAVRTLSWSGTMEAGGNNQPFIPVPGKPRPPPSATPPPQVQLSFRYEMQRPRKSRLEIDFQDETAIQVYDGARGWKLRPFLNRHEIEDYSVDELEQAAAQADLDGYLVDYTAKGTKIEVEGIEPVEGQPTYRLKVTPKGGRSLHDWVDTKTFLEVRMDGTPRRLDGKTHAVLVYLRDYRKVDGLVIPYLYETTVEGVERTEKIFIENVQVNPPLAASLFERPK